MQRNLTISLALFFLAATPILAHAANLSNISIPPDNPLYFLQIIREKIGLLFTFDALEKARYQLELVERRAEEIRNLAERGRLTAEKAMELQKKTEALISGARGRLDQAIAGGRDARELIEKMQTILERQQQILENINSKIPEEARTAIQKALEVSRRGKERAIELLNQRLSPSPEPPQVGPRQSPPGTACTMDAKLCPDGSYVGRVPPNCEFAPCRDERKPSPTPRPTARDQTPSPSPLTFIIEADDFGLYPASVTVPTGKIVTLTFKVRATKVYYDGLEFRSPKFSMVRIRPGGENSVSFVADETFSYSSYWPESGVKKADGMIVAK